MMSGIRGVDTKPEMIVRRALHAKGFRYRLHEKKLPGRPDLYFPKYKAVIQVQGCFWHKHECHLFKWPSSRSEFWREKLEANAVRDERNLYLLDDFGIRCLVIWECALKGRPDQEIHSVINLAAEWLERGISNQSFPCSK